MVDGAFGEPVAGCLTVSVAIVFVVVCKGSDICSLVCDRCAVNGS